MWMLTSWGGEEGLENTEVISVCLVYQCKAILYIDVEVGRKKKNHQNAQIQKGVFAVWEAIPETVALSQLVGKSGDKYS